MQADILTIFNTLPGAYLILYPDAPVFTIAGATDAYLEATFKDREELVGRALFEAFPDNPDDPDATGTRNLRASLDHVLQYKEEHHMADQRYDVYHPAEGIFTFKVWSPMCKPVPDENGAVQYIIHGVTDITENYRLKQEEESVQQKLEESERTLRNTILQSPVAMCILRGPSFIIEIANERMLALWDRRPEEVWDRPVFEVLHEARNQGLEETLQQVFDSGETYVANERAVTLSRGGVPHEAYLNFVQEPIRENNGQITGVLSLAIDVTEQVRSRKEVEEGHAELLFVMNFMPQLVWHTDAEGKADFFNQVYLDYTGLPLEKLTGHQWIGLLHPEDREATSIIWQKAVEGGLSSYSVEHRLRGKDGHYRWFLTRGVPLIDEQGGILKWYGTTTDIQEQKMTAEALRQSKERFDLVSRATQDAIWDWNLLSNKIWWNEGFMTLFGYKAEDIEEDIDSWYHRVHPEDRERVVGGIHEVIDNGGKQWTDEYRFRRADGSYATVLDRGYALHDKEGKPYRMLGAMQDITERKQFEASITESEKRFRTLAQNSPDLITRHGRDYRYLYASPVIEELTGIRAEEFIGKTYWELDIPPHLCSFFDEQLEIVFRTQSLQHVEFSVVRDREIHIYSRMVPEFDEEGVMSSVLVISTDVTERKKAEEALAYQQKLLETVTDNMTQALFMLGNERECVYMNEAAEQMTGFDFEEMKGWDLHDKIHHTYPDGRPYPVEECPLTQALPLNQQTHGEEVFIHKEGWFYPVAYTASPIILDGKPVGTVLEVRNTTEEKKREEVLRELSVQKEETLALLESLLRNAPIGFAFFDRNHRFLRVNDTLAEINGIPAREHIGRTVHELLPGNAEEVEAVLDQVVREKEPVLNLEIRGETRGIPGSLRYWITGFYPVLNDKGRDVNSVGAVVMEITDRIRAEEAIKANEERFRTLANSISQLAWIADADGWIQWYNSRWFEFTGSTLEEMQGWGWAKVHHPDHKERVVSFVKEAWKKGEPWELVFPLRRNDGVYRWFLTRVFPVHNEEGKLIQWIGTNTDIDEQKHAEALLEERVRQRTVELEARNKELEQFTYISHHDLQEPLRKIIMFSDMVRSEAEEKLSEASRIRLGKVTDSARRMSSALRDVLNFAALNNQEQFEKVDLDEVLAFVQTDLELLISEKKARITADNLPEIRAVPQQMHQLFYNLLNNALKFSRPGILPRIRITCTMPTQNELEAHTELAPGRQYYRIDVQDNGIGFPQDLADKIFGMFQRLHTREAYAGTGIGLALCRKVALNHGGKIWAGSTPGEGTTFSVLLPVG